MSITTELTLYTTEERFGMRETVEKLLEALGNPEKCNVLWMEQEERGWNEFLKEQEDFQLIREVECDFESLPDSIASHEVLRQFPDAPYVSVQLQDCKLGDELAEQIETMIPESLRNRCIPCVPNIRVGWHDIFECAIEPDGQFIARAFVSIQFFTYDTPADWKAFLLAIEDLPKFAEIRTILEKVTGPLDSCLIMNV